MLRHCKGNEKNKVPEDHTVVFISSVSSLEARSGISAHALGPTLEVMPECRLAGATLAVPAHTLAPGHQPHVDCGQWSWSAEVSDH